DGALLSTIAGANQAFSDTAVVAGQTYTYAVAALDAAGNVSMASAPVMVTIPLSPGTLAGLVTDAASGLPIAGAVVSDSAGTVTTDSTGHYVQNLPASSYV